MEDFNNISNIVEEINCSLVESLTANDGNLNNGTSKKIMFFYNRTSKKIMFFYNRTTGLPL